jgi:hypothetical protein
MIEADKITPPAVEKAPEAPIQAPAAVVAETVPPQPERITDQLAPHPKKEITQPQGSTTRVPYKGKNPRHEGKPAGTKEHSERRPRPEGQRPPRDPAKAHEARPKVELPHGIVDYQSITQALLKASRFRRHQHVEANGPITHLKDVRNFQTVSLQGPSSSGQSSFILQAFLKSWSETIVIVHEQKDLVAFEAKIADVIKQKKGKQPQFYQVFTVDAIIALLGRIGVPEVQKARQVITITIDKDDESPAETISTILDEYIQKRDEMRNVELRPTHPLRRVKTILVDDWKNCEVSNLTFARLARFAQICGQLPEIILLG